MPSDVVSEIHNLLDHRADGAHGLHDATQRRHDKAARVPALATPPVAHVMLCLVRCPRAGA